MDSEDARPGLTALREASWLAEARMTAARIGVDAAYAAGARADPPPRVRLPAACRAGDARRLARVVGSGTHTNKVLLPLAGRRVFTWSIRWARELPQASRTPSWSSASRTARSCSRTLDREVGPPEVQVVVGGDSRHGSEWAALQALADPRSSAARSTSW